MMSNGNSSYDRQQQAGASGWPTPPPVQNSGSSNGSRPNSPPPPGVQGQIPAMRTAEQIRLASDAALRADLHGEFRGDAPAPMQRGDAPRSLAATIGANEFIKLFVNGVPDGASESELRSLFSRFGAVKEVFHMTKKNSAFVKYASYVFFRASF